MSLLSDACRSPSPGNGRREGISLYELHQQAGAYANRSPTVYWDGKNTHAEEVLSTSIG